VRGRVREKVVMLHIGVASNGNNSIVNLLCPTRCCKLIVYLVEVVYEVPQARRL
jgi:hypothetical protein